MNRGIDESHCSHVALLQQRRLRCIDARRARVAPAQRPWPTARTDQRNDDRDGDHGTQCLGALAQAQLAHFALVAQLASEATHASSEGTTADIA